MEEIDKKGSDSNIPTNRIISAPAVKVILKNACGVNISVELFDKKYAGFNRPHHCLCEIITSCQGETYPQKFDDFFENLMETGGMIIDNIKTSDDSRVKIFCRDLIQIKRYSEKIEGPHGICGRTIIEVSLLPHEEFAIEFSISAIKNNSMVFEEYF